MSAAERTAIADEANEVLAAQHELEQLVLVTRDLAVVPLQVHTLW